MSVFDFQRQLFGSEGKGFPSVCEPSGGRFLISSGVKQTSTSCYLHPLRSELFTLPVPGEHSPTLQTAIWKKRKKEKKVICNLYLYPACGGLYFCFVLKIITAHFSFLFSPQAVSEYPKLWIYICVVGFTHAFQKSNIQ